MATQLETLPDQTTAQETIAQPETKTVRRQRFSLRGFTSLLLTLSFLAMCFSGAMLFLTPRGRTANWTDWTLLGLDKNEWGSVHVNNSVLFVAIAMLHLLLNWNVLMRYIKKKAASGLHMKKELALATVLAAVCIVGPISSVPPFSTLMALNEDIKDYWDGNAQQPPVPHAEELSLAELAETIGLSVDEVSTALRGKGYDVSDADQTVGDIGKQQEVAPSAVFAAIRDRFPSSRGWGRVGGGGGGEQGQSSAGPGRGGNHGEDDGRGGTAGRPGWGPGNGRSQEAASGIQDVTVSRIADAVGLTVEEIVATLNDEGLDSVQGSTTLNQLSDQQGKSPQDILDTLHERHPDTRGWGRITGQRGGGWH